MPENSFLKLICAIVLKQLPILIISTRRKYGNKLWYKICVRCKKKYSSIKLNKTGPQTNKENVKLYYIQLKH